MKDFSGKGVVITGGASGIGLGLAQAFAARGARVVVADIDGDAAGVAAAAIVRDGGQAIGAACDVSDRASVEALAQTTVAAFGRAHVICNNAGVAVSGALGTIRPKDWDWIFDVNLKGVIHGVETFLPLIRAHGEGGHVLNTASVGGFVAGPFAEPYAATKYAIVAMSEGWAAQLRGGDIGLSILCPHFVKTQIDQSERVRPGRFDAGGAREENERSKIASKAMQAGLPPEIVAARAIEGIEQDELYIFTHPTARAVVEARFARILAAFDATDRSQALSSISEWPPFWPG
ncbi:SDR family NAD(P)-dependent oxidoreductase [Sphingomonas sp. MMS24-J13]|uniref:SDR family NAD(P)-dependent oxidoreductase n=1 Tax=Sphingomonas sp. MMS24-J13 TaxID=3238686 RepID=UPI00384AC9AC